LKSQRYQNNLCTITRIKMGKAELTIATGTGLRYVDILKCKFNESELVMGCYRGTSCQIIGIVFYRNSQFTYLFQ